MASMGLLKLLAISLSLLRSFCNCSFYNFNVVISMYLTFNSQLAFIIWLRVSNFILEILVTFVVSFSTTFDYSPSAMLIQPNLDVSLLDLGYLSNCLKYLMASFGLLKFSAISLSLFKSFCNCSFYNFYVVISISFTFNSI